MSNPASLPPVQARARGVYPLVLPRPGGTDLTGVGSGPRWVSSVGVDHHAAILTADGGVVAAPMLFFRYTLYRTNVQNSQGVLNGCRRLKVGPDKPETLWNSRRLIRLHACDPAGNPTGPPPEGVFNDVDDAVGT